MEYGKIAYLIYFYIMVCLIAAPILSWEIGYRGFSNTLRKPKAGVILSVILILIYGFWGYHAGLGSPLTTGVGASRLLPSVFFFLWVTSVCAYARSRSYPSLFDPMAHLKPIPQRYYDDAKRLQDGVYFFRRIHQHQPIPNAKSAKLRSNGRLQLAEQFYYKAIEASQQLLATEDGQHESFQIYANIGTAYCQLSLIYKLQGRLDKAQESVMAALRILESARDREPSGEEERLVLDALGYALWISGTISCVLGKYQYARESYLKSIEIDKRYGNERESSITTKLLEDVERRMEG